jgi:hypothetical protein
MKTINESEFLIWILSAIAFMIMFAITNYEAFIILAMSSVILARISRSDNRKE